MENEVNLISKLNSLLAVFMELLPGRSANLPYLPAPPGFLSLLINSLKLEIYGADEAYC
jgi:hypothetical protein